MLCRQRDGFIRILLRGRSLASKVMKHRGKRQGVRQTVGFRTMSRKRYSFPKDTTASILTSGLLGETYIGLDAGGDEKTLADGDRITITQSAIVLERLIGQFLFSKAAEEPKP